MWVEFLSKIKKLSLDRKHLTRKWICYQDKKTGGQTIKRGINNISAFVKKAPFRIMKSYDASPFVYNAVYLRINLLRRTFKSCSPEVTYESFQWKIAVIIFLEPKLIQSGACSLYLNQNPSCDLGHYPMPNGLWWYGSSTSVSTSLEFYDRN